MFCQHKNLRLTKQNSLCKNRYMKIGEVVNGWRRVTGRPLRDVSKEIGINTSVLHAVEGGADCDSETLVTILCWLLDRTPRKRRTTAQKEGQ